MKTLTRSLALLCALWLSPAPALADDDAAPRWTLEDLLQTAARPFTIGHRGTGDNWDLGHRPVENTARAVRAAYLAGLQLVEVDVQQTADGVVVCLHDDFLPDWTPVPSLTLVELRQRFPQVATLDQVLAEARRANAQATDAPGGLLVVELKQPSPYSDPGDVGEEPLVREAVAAVRRAGMTQQVLFESFSPALLAHAVAMAPEIPRVLAVNPLQLLTPAEVEAITGLPVTPIDKSAGFGLQWALIGPIYRLPGYASVEQFVMVSLALGCRAVDLDLLMLAQAEATQPGSGAYLVAMLQSLGLDVLAATAATPEEYAFLASLGVDGIYSDLIDLPGSDD
jgi:glycerophosphoryl diester phosphodiesterase